jgi:hypothetical protein
MFLAAALAAPPDVPAPVSPADGAVVTGPVTLRAAVSDADGDELRVRFHVRPARAPGEDFRVVALPDTQFYACGCQGGQPETFLDQTAWIADESGAVYVAQLGDCVQDGDAIEAEWEVADAAFSMLEDPERTGLPEGIPYGVSVGNHDQTPEGDPALGSTDLYNAWFGAARFDGRAYVVEGRDGAWDDHVQVFDAGGLGFVVVYLEYDPTAANVAWASEVLAAHRDRLGIVVSHWLLDTVGAWSPQGAALAEASPPNLVLLLSGHVPGEGRRVDWVDGRPVHAMLSDYQSRDAGGDGWLRILDFSPAGDTITVSTYSTTRDEWEVDEDSAFTVDADLDRLTWELVGESDAPSGEVSRDVTLEPGEWEWTVDASDGVDTVAGPVWSFTVEAPRDEGDDQRDDEPDDAGEPIAVRSEGCGCGEGAAWLLLLPPIVLPLRYRRRPPEPPCRTSR